MAMQAVNTKTGAVSQFAETVLPALAEWTQAGLKTALVTVVGIEGGAPRPVGAQMAVAEDGRAVGHISGGCLEGALVAEAQAAIAAGGNRLVRYGAGSPYIDVRLPCGSGLDIYIDQQASGFAHDMTQLWRSRQPFALLTDLGHGESSIQLMIGGDARTARAGDVFTRVYWPQPRLQVIGAGPPAGFLAMVAAQIGWEVELITPNAAEVQVGGLDRVSVREMHGADFASALKTDAWTAGAVVFHDHEWEIPVIAALLRTDCFYIGAVGSRRVHELRLAALRELGFADPDLKRIHGPAGVIGQTKSPATLAVSVLAEVVATARDLGFSA
jgi:xanthine dehydrogenase accessory factor